MLRRPRLALALLLAIPATAAAGCGATSSVQNAVDPVAQAAQHTSDAGGAQVALHGTVSVAGQTVPIDGSGVFDTQAREGRLGMTVTVPGLGALRMDYLMTGTVIYLHMPASVASHLPGGKTWIKIDLEKLAKGMGIDLGALEGAQGDQVGQFLGYLKASGGAHPVGTETVDGFRTTHYTARIGLTKAAKALGPDVVKSMQKLRRLTGNTTLPVDVWIDKQQLVRRMAVSYSTKQPAPTAFTMRMDFLRYHVPVHVTAPPAGRVLDASSMAGALSGT